MNFVPVALALGTGFLWALAQVLTKLVVRDLNPTASNIIRFSFLAIALTSIVLINGIGPIETWPTVLAVISGGLCSCISLQIYFFCMARTPAYTIVPVANASPLWAVLLALLLLSEEIIPILPISLAMVIGGAFLLVQRKKEPNKWKPAIPLTMVVAALWGLDQTIKKPAIELGMSALTFIWISMISAAVVINLWGAFTKPWRGQRFTKINVGLTLASATSGQLVGGLLYMFALKMEKVISLTPFTSAAIPFGFLLSILIAQERPNWRAVIGMFIIFAGVILAAM